MKKADMQVYRDRLLALRARMRGDMTAMADVALRKSGAEGAENSSMPIHMAELGSDNYEQEFTLSLLESEGDTLGAIEEALVRIESGSYAKCVDCGGVIPKARLNLIPFTSLCVKCAAKQEGN